MKVKISRTGGFTLVELMITLVVMIVVLAIGMPGIAQLRSNGELTATTNELLAALNYARSEAVRRGTAVSVNPAGGGWSDGWSVNDAGGAALRVFPEPAANSTVTASVSPIVYQSLGNVSAAGCFDISVNGTNRVRSIPVLLTGRASFCKDTCANVAGDPTLCD